MSELPHVDPSASAASTLSPDEPFDDLVEPAGAGTSERATPPREGLPPGFRMRHDSHYVDQLAARAAPAPLRLVAVKDIEAPEPDPAWNLGALTASIRSVGLLQPLIVRSVQGRFELVAGAKRLAAARRAGLTELPCVVYYGDADGARAIAAAARLQVEERRDARESPAGARALAQELAEHAAGLLACLQLLPARGSLRERVALALARAEAQRTAWFAQALGVLEADPVLVRADVAAGSLVEAVLAALEAERHLSGIEAVADIPRPPILVRADEHLVRTALGVAASAVVALAARVRGARVRLRLHAAPERSAALIDVTQEAVTLPSWAVARFFDPEWRDRPGGAAAGLALVAARRIAELHGGRLDAIATSRGGCGLRLALPVA